MCGGMPVPTKNSAMALAQLLQLLLSRLYVSALYCEEISLCVFVFAIFVWYGERCVRRAGLNETDAFLQTTFQPQTQNSSTAKISQKYALQEVVEELLLHLRLAQVKHLTLE